MKIDAYVLQARVAPVLIVLAPAVALFAAVAGASDAGSWSAALLGVAGAAVGLGLSDAARKRGRALEAKRWKGTGSPTIQRLVAETPDGEARREQVRAVFNIEIEDRQDAERAAEALRQHARREENIAVAAANIAYGRARNLCALRGYGAMIAVTAGAISLARIAGLIPASIEAITSTPGWSIGTVLVVSVVVLWYLLDTATSDWLTIVDDLYTTRLLGYLDLLASDRIGDN